MEAHAVGGGGGLSLLVERLLALASSPSYNPGQNSWDIKAITRKNDVFPPSPLPRCNVDVRLSKSFSVDSTLLGGGGAQKKWFTKTTLQTCFLSGGLRVYLTKCIFSLYFHNCLMMF